MMQLIVLRGLPCSGKSTWAEQWINEDLRMRCRVNKDLIRQMLSARDFFPPLESTIHDLFLQQVRILLSRGKSVVADNTHLKRSYVDELHRLAASVGNVLVVEKWFAVELSECLQRMISRDRKVPLDVMEAMDRSREAFSVDVETFYDRPSASLVVDQVLPSAIIVDLDGTFALIGDRSPYDASRCDLVDHPNLPVIDAVVSAHGHGKKVIFMSGREEKDRAPTQRFIEANLFRYADTLEIHPTKHSIPYELHMRTSGDMRKDSIVKRELYEAHVKGRYNVSYVIDDRPTVVRMWRNELGLTCFAVNDVEF